MSVQTLEQRPVNGAVHLIHRGNLSANEVASVNECQHCNHPRRMTFRAFWPIVDQRIPYDQLIAEAAEDVERLALQAHAHITDFRAGRWSIERSSRVPGSGRVAPTVLIYEAPALREVPAWRTGRAS